jgi:hypothetical protein
MSKTMERARASAKQLNDVPAQLAALDTMMVPQLAEKFQELFGVPTRTRNKPYLQKRLAWRIQELAEGGLPASAVQRIKELGDDLPERWRMKQDAKVRAAAPAQPLEPRDDRVPPVGTVVRRLFNGVTYEVTVCAEGFAYAGERYKTLSAIARHITGTPWNGFTFFGLQKRVESNKERAS